MTRGVAPRFPTTHWSLVARAGDGDAKTRHDALSDLLRGYLVPLKAHLVRTRRLDASRADDLLQSFLADKVLEQDLIRRADRTKGKFRTFLLHALDGFVTDCLRRERVRGHSPEDQISLDGRPSPADLGPGPDQVFDAVWARQVIEAAVAAMRAECDKSERTALWGVFEARVLRPSMEHVKPPSYAELAPRFGFATAVEASNAVVTGKRMLTRHLWAVVGRYVEDADEIEAEIQDLRAILARVGAALDRCE